MKNLLNEPMGFRLHRLEVYNWGTFDKVIHCITPHGATTVLTGANGSGKSTLVDVFLTLFVENNKRNYNLASGANQRRERNERSYIRGDYSRTRDEGESEARANSLRDNDQYSVLLAIFKDIFSQKTVSIAQVQWIAPSGSVQHRYYVALFELSIEANFYKRQMTQRDFDKPLDYCDDKFKDYIVAVRKALGLAGREKAFDLFNQTVAVKEIASLNQFVRDHMLDKGNPEEKVDTLRGQYEELNEAYLAIQRASRQGEILKPLVNSAKNCRNYATQIDGIRIAQRYVAVYVAQQAIDVLQYELNQLEQKFQFENEQKERIERDMAKENESLQGVQRAIDRDNISQLKRELEAKQSATKNDLKPRQDKAKIYNELAQALVYKVYSDLQTFHHNRTLAQQQQQQAIAERQTLNEQRDSRLLERRDLQQRVENLGAELAYLNQNRSLIPSNVANIRQQLAQMLAISEEELPFAGELIKVRDDQQAWEGALQRLLRGFAQELIVSDRYHARVRQHVNQTHLNGRLVYRYVEKNSLPIVKHQHPDNASNKLEIRPDTPYGEWLANRLIEEFNYVCCDISEMPQHKRAITVQGQVKHSTMRHEKDDRSKINDRQTYYLGWDNRAKRKQIERELRQAEHDLRTIRDDIATIERQLESNQQGEKAIIRLLDIQNFDEIDWRKRQEELDGINRQLAELDKKSGQLQQLEKQKQDIQHRLKELTQQRDKVVGTIAQVTDKITRYERSYNTKHNLTKPMVMSVTGNWRTPSSKI